MIRPAVPSAGGRARAGVDQPSVSGDQPLRPVSVARFLLPGEGRKSAGQPSGGADPGGVLADLQDLGLRRADLGGRGRDHAGRARARRTLGVVLRRHRVGGFAPALARLRLRGPLRPTFAVRPSPAGSASALAPLLGHLARRLLVGLSHHARPGVAGSRFRRRRSGASRLGPGLGDALRAALFLAGLDWPRSTSICPPTSSCWATASSPCRSA